MFVNLCCVSKKNYKFCCCIPLWFIFILIMLLTFTENILFLVNPIFILPSATMSLIFLTAICARRSLKIRNFIWVSYLIIALIQLFMTIVIFGLVIIFPDEEECTTTKDPDTGKTIYTCIEKESKTTPGLVMFILCLIGFFSIKSCCLVCFLHAFARKVVFDERQRINEAKKNAKAEAKA